MAEVKPRTFDEYLDRLDAPARAALDTMRRAIHTAAPSCEECIAYDMPSFRIDGRYFASIAAAKKHYALHIGTHPIIAHAADLSGYETSKGTVRFPLDAPIPVELVRRLAATRVAERAG